MKNQVKEGLLGENKIKGGVKASRRYPSFHSKDELSLIYVRYKDHVIFKNCSHSDMKPSIREVVGWLVLETQEAIYICCDRSVEPLPHEKCSESGWVILKSDVLERRKLSDFIDG